MWTENFQTHKLDLEKTKEPEIKLQTYDRSLEKAREFPPPKKNNTFTSASLMTLNPLTVWITTNCGIFLKRWEYQTTLIASWETCMQDKKQQLELDMEQWTGSKLGREYVKAL